MRFNASRAVSSLATVFALLSAVMRVRPAVEATPVDNNAFRRTWQRTDKLVAHHETTRTWKMGPATFTTVMYESYA